MRRKSPDPLAFLRARGPLFTIARGRRRDERIDQCARHGRNIDHGPIERGLIGLLRLGKARQLADELDRRGANLFVSSGRIEIEERTDVPAHAGYFTVPAKPYCPDDDGAG